MNNLKTQRILFIFGAILLCYISYLTLNSGGPTLYLPTSLAVFVPAIIIEAFFSSNFFMIFLGTITIPITFMVFSYHLCIGELLIPNRSKIGSIILILLSSFYLVGSWEFGTHLYGKSFILTIYFFNLTIWGILLILYKLNLKKQTYYSNYLFHWLMFAWLEWSAFPYLGEGP